MPTFLEIKIVKHANDRPWENGVRSIPQTIIAMLLFGDS